MDYLSLFSGLGGLESQTSSPVGFCELDYECHAILRDRHPDSWIHDDVGSLKPPRVEVVAGGWPCQDISIAGKQAGLVGARSGLLYEMVRVARDAQAHTIVGENVANLLRMRNGEEMHETLRAFHEGGFPVVTWRVVNLRQFGVPQHRSRLILIASQYPELAYSIFRPMPYFHTEAETASGAAGFYWTAGTHSINYSRGYVPTIKVGSALKIPSPPAVHFGDTVRQLSIKEVLALQGFQDDRLEELASRPALYRMAGNAVAPVIGSWVLDGVLQGATCEVPEIDVAHIVQNDSLFPDIAPTKFPPIGLSTKGRVSALRSSRDQPFATNLIQFIDIRNTVPLSRRASNGLLSRLERSGQKIPTELERNLREIAA